MVEQYCVAMVNAYNRPFNAVRPQNYIANLKINHDNFPLSYNKAGLIAACLALSV
jgi:hypothetical protein